ncbi:hypothetical protein STCU_01768 [Strigomonas culicis]|nr:hypothetical protein STCU_01768 [Strigomonas culicis]|eukprot:EPY34203.1 hypothetical protein STCU_01768 [Strigomonas culicis]
MAAFCGGVLAFAARPHIPIVLPVLTTVIPSLLVVGVPRAYMLRGYRLLCFAATFASAGYAFGPIGWIAQDSLFFFLLCTVCTMSGLVVPLFITRGFISYLLSTQLFSLSLLVSFITAPKEARLRYSPFNVLKTQKGVRLILRADYNVVVTVQMLAGILILALHTLPVLHYVVTRELPPRSRSRRAGAPPASFASQRHGRDEPTSPTTPDAHTEDELEVLADLDDVLEAFCICAGWSYMLFRVLHRVTQTCMKRVIVSNGGAVGSVAGGASDNSSVSGPLIGIMAGDRRVDVRTASAVVSTGLVFLWYIKVISLLQRQDPGAALDQFRYVCDSMSPLRYLLGVSQDF